MSETCAMLVAALLGAAIGLERKVNNNTTGIHTHTLVALGAALFILLGAKLAAASEASRIASNVVMGVGFLCSAVIMRDGMHVRGLNTAVTIWCSAAIGAIAGAGHYDLAVMGTIVIILSNFLLHLLEHKSGLFKTDEVDDDGNKR